MAKHTQVTRKAQSEIDKLVAQLAKTRLGKKAKEHAKKKHHKPEMKGKGVYVAGATYTGHGNYKSMIKKMAIRGMKNVGNSALHTARNEAMRALEGYSGMGSYNDPTVTNELVVGGGGHIKTLPMTFHTYRNDETDIVSIRCREYITDLVGPTTPFNVQVYDLNPGLYQSFAKLAQFAVNFDCHRLRECVVMYQSTTTDIGSSSNGQCGVIIIAGSPNVLTPQYTSKRAMLDAKGAVSAKTTENCVYGFECDPAKGGKDWQYVRYLPVLQNQDQKTYDAGCIQIAISNSPTGFNNQQLGELFIEYTWELKDCNLRSALGWAIPRDLFITPYNNPTAVGSNLAGAVGTTNFYSGLQNSIGCLFTPNTLGPVITFPNQFEGAVAVKVIVVPLATVTGANLTNVGMVPVNYVNFVRIMDMYDQQGNPTYILQTPLIGTGTAPAAALQMYSEAHFYITPAAEGSNNTLSLQGAVGCTSAVALSVEITQYNSMGLTEFGAGATTSAPLNFVYAANGQVVGGSGL